MTYIRRRPEDKVVLWLVNNVNKPHIVYDTSNALTYIFYWCCYLGTLSCQICLTNLSQQTSKHSSEKSKQVEC